MDRKHWEKEKLLILNSLLRLEINTSKLAKCWKKTDFASRFYDY